MGQPSDFDYYVDVAQQQMQQPTFYQEHVEEKVDLAQDIVVGIGDSVGYGTLLVVMALGAGVLFKKRIRKWLND